MGIIGIFVFIASHIINATFNTLMAYFMFSYYHAAPVWLYIFGNQLPCQMLVSAPRHILVSFSSSVVLGTLSIPLVPSAASSQTHSNICIHIYIYINTPASAQLPAQQQMTVRVRFQIRTQRSTEVTNAAGISLQRMVEIESRSNDGRYLDSVGGKSAIRG